MKTATLPASRQFPLAGMSAIDIPALFKPSTSPLQLVRDELAQVRHELEQTREALRLANAALGYHRDRMAAHVLVKVTDNT